MSQLTIGMIPGYSDLPDYILTDPAQNIATEDSLIKICQNSKFAAVRHETIFMGYFKNGDAVGRPISAVDGYVYSQKEMRYAFVLYSTRGAGPNFVSGQADPPSFDAGQLLLTQPTTIYWTECDIDDITGVVAVTVSYFSQGRVSETITHDGIVKVHAICQRQSLNT